MQLTAEEIGAINVTLSSNAPEIGDRDMAKDIYLMIQSHINLTTGHFEASEVELNVPQKAFLLKLIPTVPWLTPQLIKIVDPLLVKLTA